MSVSSPSATKGMPTNSQMSTPSDPAAKRNQSLSSPLLSLASRSRQQPVSDEEKKITKRLRNAEAVNKYRERKRREEEDLHRAFLENEKRIKELEQSIKDMKRELRRRPRLLRRGSREVKKNSTDMIRDAKKSLSDLNKEAKKNSNDLIRQATKSSSDLTKDAKKSSTDLIREAKKNSDNSTREVKSSDDSKLERSLLPKSKESRPKWFGEPF